MFGKRFRYGNNRLFCLVESEANHVRAAVNQALFTPKRYAAAAGMKKVAETEGFEPTSYRVEVIRNY